MGRPVIHPTARLTDGKAPLLDRLYLSQPAGDGRCRLSHVCKEQPVRPGHRRGSRGRGRRRGRRIGRIREVKRLLQKCCRVVDKLSPLRFFVGGGGCHRCLGGGGGRGLGGGCVQWGSHLEVGGELGLGGRRGFKGLLKCGGRFCGG